MRATARHLKLGLLGLLGALAVLLALFAIGLRTGKVDGYHTYFDESVHGLEKGAVVKFRGVRVGQVESIRVAPDHRLIDVELAIDRGFARDLGLDKVAGDLRAQLVLFGITGVKLVDLDFADERSRTPISLTFPAPARYIPSRRSMLGALQGDVDQVTKRVPALLDEATRTMVALREGIRDAQSMFGEARSAMGTVNRVARSIDRAQLPRAVATTLASIEEMSRTTDDATSGLGDAVHDVSDAARAVRDFVDMLEREPDVLVKGRARPR